MDDSLPPSPAADSTALFAAPVNPAALDAPLIDANGHDLAAYDWVPVLKKRRADGWSPEKQRAFIEALADTGSVMQAAQSVGMSGRSVQKLRRSPGAENFDQAWSAAIDTASKKLLDEAFERALVGSDEPVFDRDGRRVGRRLRQSDRMLQFLLRGYMPERFGFLTNAAAAVSPRRSALPVTPVAEALAHLLPEPPAAPHTLLAPEALEDALLVADLMDGKLAPWRCDPEPDPVLNSAPPIAEALERQLEDAKRVGCGKAPISDDEWARLRPPPRRFDVDG